MSLTREQRDAIHEGGAIAMELVLRHQIANQAMVALIAVSNQDLPPGRPLYGLHKDEKRLIAEHAYAFADVMLEVGKL